jgi:hypothetical protein
VLTDKINHRVFGQVTFSDGNMMQAYAKCSEDPNGDSYPGLTIAIAAFTASNRAPKPLRWHHNEIELPVLINDQHHPDARLTTENPRGNVIFVGFYDLAAAKKVVHGEELPFVRLIPDSQLPGAMNRIAWDDFLKNTGGTIAELLRATSVRVQLPLIDGTADVVELNPQDEVLKNYVQECSSKF